ncbi:MAG: hypothetical protein ACR5K2_04595 [Wolbachia sp.]
MWLTYHKKKNSLLRVINCFIN